MRAFGSGRSPSDVEPFLHDVFFGHPWVDPDLPSLAAVDRNGRLVGCLGVMPRPMILDGRPVRAAVTHNFLVDPEHRRGLTALALMQAMGGLGVDASFCEPNEAGRAVGQAVGARVVQSRARRWLWPLRPSALAARLARGGRTPSGVGGVLDTLASALDAMAHRLPGSPFRPARTGARAEPLTPDGWAETIERCTSAMRLRPVYSASSLAWLLRTLAATRRDQALRGRSVIDGGEVVGWFVYYARPRGVGRVLQLGATPHAATPHARGRVLDCLVRDALETGCLALSGASDPGWDDDTALATWPARERQSWPMVLTGSSDLRNVLESSDAFFTRLEGEGWLRFAF